MTKCYACAGTGRSYVVLGGAQPTPCRFCDETGQRDPCPTFTPENPESAPYPMRPCVDCGHPQHAHPAVVRSPLPV